MTIARVTTIHFLAAIMLAICGTAWGQMPNLRTEAMLVGLDDGLEDGLSGLNDGLDEGLDGLLDDSADDPENPLQIPMQVSTA